MHFTPDTLLTILADTSIARVYLVHMPSNHCLHKRACTESLCSCHLSTFSGWIQACSHTSAILDSTSTNPHKGQVPRIQRPITTFCTLGWCTSPPYSFTTRPRLENHYIVSPCYMGVNEHLRISASHILFIRHVLAKKLRVDIRNK